jgi:hypothetical protein
VRGSTELGLGGVAPSPGGGHCFDVLSVLYETGREIGRELLDTNNMLGLSPRNGGIWVMGSSPRKDGEGCTPRTEPKKSSASQAHALATPWTMPLPPLPSGATHPAACQGRSAILEYPSVGEQFGTSLKFYSFGGASSTPPLAIRTAWTSTSPGWLTPPLATRGMARGVALPSLPRGPR